jgi:hypothetical protein
MFGLLCALLGDQSGLCWAKNGGLGVGRPVRRTAAGVCVERGHLNVNTEVKDKESHEVRFIGCCRCSRTGSPPTCLGYQWQRGFPIVSTALAPRSTSFHRRPGIIPRTGSLGVTHSYSKTSPA